LVFVQTAQVDRQGRLRRSWRRQAATVPGFAEDYAWLTWGLVELYQARHQVGDLEQALRWNSETLRLFADGEGDLWECGADAEAVMGRGRLTVDGAVPAAGSIVALNLLRLGDLTGSGQLQMAGERLLGARLGAQPAAHAQLLIALDYALGPRQQVVVSVPTAAREAEPFLAAVRGRFLPRTATMVLNQGDDTLARLSSLPASRPTRNDQPIAYLCSGQSCQLPALSPGDLLHQLEAVNGGITLPGSP
jgi:uncharacterized protein YyaL (SSP411 family)